MDRVFDNPYPTCNCRHTCKHAGGLHSYVSAYKRVLSVVRPAKVFEWGPGRNSEIAVAAGAFVVAVEHDPKYVPDLSPKVFTVNLVELHSDAYVDIEDHQDADMFFVDGRRRAACIRAVFEKANHQAFLCLHDAQRERYHEALRLFPYVRFLNVGFCVASYQASVLELPREEPKRV